MKNILRTTLPDLPGSERKILLESFRDAIVREASPQAVLVFGSVVSGKFDDYSDLDFVIVFKDAKSAKEGSKKLYRMKRPANRSVDFLCVDATTFNRKSKLGGVFYVAAQDGLYLYP